MARRPPLDGSLYLPAVLDFHLEHNPSRIAYTFVQDELHTIGITFEQLARAAHRAAYLVRPNRDGNDGRVVAIIASADVLLYQTVVLGCVRAGLVPFLISPRNSSTAIDEMLAKVSCSEVLCVRAHSSEFKLIESLSNSDLVITEIPPLEALYGPDLQGLSADFRPYPQSKTPTDPNDIAFIIHSSGSTGFPKPVPQKFVTILHWMGFLNVSGMEDPRIEICAAMAIPSFHAFGVNFQLLYPLTLAKPAAIFPPTTFNFVTGQAVSDKAPMFPQPANVLRHVQLTKSDVLLSVPSLLTAWRSSAGDVEVLKTLKAVCCSSGPLPHGVGDELVSQGVPLCTSYGATEFGIPTYRLPLNDHAKPTVDLDPKSPERMNDWNYLAFNNLTKLRLIPTGGDETFELQILTCDTHQPAVENLPDVKGYATCDVVQAHPTTKGLWRVIGRTDDVIVLSAGEKVVPGPMEDTIGSSPLLSGVIMFGRGRPHCGLLIEPRDPTAWEERKTELIDKVWPLIEEANSGAPAFSRILRDMIIVTKIDKPMERVGKGSTARQATLDLYETEINRTYTSFDSGRSVEPPSSWAASDVLKWLERRADSLSSVSANQLDVNRDLFELGFDSISAVSLRSQIAGALPEDVSSNLSQTFVYDNPTLSEMASKLESLMSGGMAETDVEAKQHALESMIKKYTSFAPLNADQVARHGYAVLLTGSTGSLGSYVLEGLLRETRISKVYVLNRPSSSSAYERQKHSFASKGLEAHWLESSKLIWLDGDVDAIPQQVKNDINVIIHNAWRLDFNLALSSYEPLISSTRSLIDIARTAKHKVKFIFTSSVSAAQSWDTELGMVPEEILDPNHALGKGYGESKSVAEAILAKSGVKFTSLRIGQISGGAPAGAWAPSDWVPSMVRTSVELRALPAAVGTLSWIPMPVVAKSVLDALFSTAATPVLNLVHPHPILWETLMRDLALSLTENGVTKTDLPTIEFTEWMKKLETLDAQSVEIQEKAPAIKLLSYFRQFSEQDADMRLAGCGGSEAEAGGRPSFKTAKACEVSRAMTELKEHPLGRTDVDGWVSYWKGIGFLPSA